MPNGVGHALRAEHHHSSHLARIACPTLATCHSAFVNFPHGTSNSDWLFTIA